MHHYRWTERWDARQVVVERFAAIMRGRVDPVTIDDVLAAGRLANEHQGLNAGPPAPGGDAPLGRDPHRYGRRRLRQCSRHHQAGSLRRQGVETGVGLPLSFHDYGCRFAPGICERKCSFNARSALSEGTLLTQPIQGPVRRQSETQYIGNLTNSVVSEYMPFSMMLNGLANGTSIVN